MNNNISPADLTPNKAWIRSSIINYNFLHIDWDRKWRKDLSILEEKPQMVGVLAVDQIREMKKCPKQ
jgi:hypothetical protein